MRHSLQQYLPSLFEDVLWTVKDMRLSILGICFGHMHNSNLLFMQGLPLRRRISTGPDKRQLVLLGKRWSARVICLALSLAPHN